MIKATENQFKTKREHGVTTVYPNALQVIAGDSLPLTNSNDDVSNMALDVLT